MMTGAARSEPPEGQDVTLKKVAYLYAEGEAQKRIASMLSLSPSMVSRLVDQARQSGLLEETVTCKLAAEQQMRLRGELYGSDSLLKKLKDVAYADGVASLTQLKIIPTGLEIKGDPSWDQAVVMFGRKAAAYCLDLIRQCEVFGVTYGRTLAALANGLAELSATPAKTRTPVVCVPLWGEPLSPWEKPKSSVFRDPAKFSSSGLAAAMHRILNEGTPQGSERTPTRQPLCLDFVPAFRPEHYPEEKFNAVLEFACSASSYGDIFPVPDDWLDGAVTGAGRARSGRQSKGQVTIQEGKRPLIDHLDGIFTSVGSKDQPGRFWSGEFFRQGDIDLSKLRRGAFGDLGGAFIVNPTANKADREYVTTVNERWTGVKETHFRRCAVRARENSLPGVTVLAVGAVRAEIVLQCVKRGLVNYLVLDSDCAEKLAGLV